MTRNPGSPPSCGPYGNTGATWKSKGEHHDHKHSDSTLPQLPGTSQGHHPSRSRSNLQHASRHSRAGRSALYRAGSGASVHEESSCSLKSSKNLYRDRRKSEANSSIEAKREQPASNLAEDGKVRN